MDILAAIFLAFFAGFFAAIGAIVAFEIIQIFTGKGRAVFLTYTKAKERSPADD
jgi:hypothetical protein